MIPFSLNKKECVNLQAKPDLKQDENKTILFFADRFGVEFL